MFKMSPVFKKNVEITSDFFGQFNQGNIVLLDIYMYMLRYNCFAGKSKLLSTYKAKNYDSISSKLKFMVCMHHQAQVLNDIVFSREYGPKFCIILEIRHNLLIITPSVQIIIISKAYENFYSKYTFA